MRIFLIFLLNITILYSQIKVAVLDFENTSTIEKYDGFGKAMSNMLLTDLKNNIHPRKVSFLERSQLNKILNEQQLQNTKNFDKNTAVTFGKLAGVKYVILGGIYVLDGVCNLNSRMVDVESSEIIYAKESNGKITDWLNLKTKLAEEVSLELNNPIEIEEDYTNVEVNEGTISQYSKVIELLENGELEEASNLLSVLTSIQPDFKYLDELKFDIEQLKEQVAKNTADIAENTSDISENKGGISMLNKSGGLVIELNTINEYINNLKSDLLDFKGKRKLFRELFLKFDYDKIEKNYNKIGFLFMIDWGKEDEKLIKEIIAEDLKFLESIKTNDKKKLFLEMTLSEISSNHGSKNTLRLELSNEIELISKKLFSLYNFSHLNEKEFIYFMFYFAFSMEEFGNPSNDFYKSKLINFLDPIDQSLRLILSNYNKKDFINDIEISFKSKTSYSRIFFFKKIISFGYLINVSKRFDNEIFEQKGILNSVVLEKIENELSSQISPSSKFTFMLAHGLNVSGIMSYSLNNISYAVEELGYTLIDLDLNKPKK